MLLFAVETTSNTGSLALAEFSSSGPPKLLTHRSWQKKSSHSEVITLELIRALKDVGQGLQDISHLAVDVGPGSFTGIRVGLNLVRSLSYSLNRPVCPVQSLEVLALQNLKAGESAVLAIPAVQTFIYAGSYRRTASQIERLAPIVSCDRSTAQDLVSQTKVDQLIFANDEPRAETLVQCLNLSSTFISWENVKPLYIRSSEAEEKLRKGLLKPIP